MARDFQKTLHFNRKNCKKKLSCNVAVNISKMQQKMWIISTIASVISGVII